MRQSSVGARFVYVKETTLKQFSIIIILSSCLLSFSFFSFSVVVVVVK